MVDPRTRLLAGGHYGQTDSVRARTASFHKYSEAGPCRRGRLGPPPAQPSRPLQAAGHPAQNLILINCALMLESFTTYTENQLLVSYRQKLLLMI